MKRCAVLLSLAVLPSFAQLPPAISWQVKPIFPWVRKVVHLNGHFLAGGFDGEVMHSRDGEVWSGVYIGTRGVIGSITDFTFANGTYYAVQGPDLLLSTNLTDWRRITNQFSRPMNALLHHDGTLIAAGSDLWLSTNGNDWEMLSFRAPGILSLAFGNGLYVGAGSGIIISTNAIDWREVSSAGGYEVAFANDRFVVVGQRSVLVSTNGQDWSTVTNLSQAFGVTSGADTFATVTERGSIFSSEDATGWSEVLQVTENLLHSVAYGNDRFVVGGWGPVLVSEDGTHFRRAFSSPTSTRGIAQGNGMLVMSALIPEGGRPDMWTNQHALFISTNNGASWQFRTTPWTQSIHEFKFLNQNFLAAGGGLVALSDDAQQWKTKLLPGIWRAAAFGAGKYVVAGGLVGPAELAVSEDGTNWLKLPSILPEPVIGLAFAENHFVAVGGGVTGVNGFAASSSNGIDWEVQIEGLTNRLLDVAFGNEAFVAVGDNGAVLTSSNAVSWQAQSKFTTPDLTTVHFAAGLFVAAANAGTKIWTSTDGHAWSSYNIGFQQNYSDIEFANGRFFLTGADHWLVQSTPLLPRLDIIRANGLISLRLHIPLGMEAGIEASSDLLNWSPFEAIPRPQPDSSVTFQLSTDSNQQFFRARSEP